MKQIKLWLTTIVVLLCSLMASAHDFSVGGIYYNITSSTNLTVAVTYRGTSYDSYSNEYTGIVTIPKSVTYNSNTYRVTSIGNSAFFNCSSLTSITIPESVTSIGNYAYSSCSSLTSITILGSVTSIGNLAFSNCTSLTSITIPGSVTSIGENVFYNCSSLTSITIPGSVTSIGNYAFSNCTSLTSITIPEGVTSIGNEAFYNCSKLTDVSIPNSVTKIGQRAFGNCTSLTNINISNTVTSLPEVFRGCTSLKNVEIPNSVTSLGYTFYGCKNLTDIVIPSSVTNIDDCTFRDCSNLKNVIIPNSVTKIGWAAFAGCSGLTSVTIPESVNEIISGAFAQSYALTEVICKRLRPISIDKGEFTNLRATATLYVPKGSKKLYTNATGWSNFKNIIEFSLTPEYTITYMVDDNVYYTAVIEQGAEIPSIDTPTKEGHTFAGWENLPSTMPEEDIIVCATFTPNNYNVTFKANGEIVVSESLAYGTVIIAPEAPEIEDYTFMEWTDLLETVPAHDVEFVAVYKQVGTRITDDAPSYNNDDIILFDRIRYTRTFNNTEWQALYVPFEIPVTEEFLADFEVADLNDIRQYDYDNDGMKDETVIEAFKVMSGTLEANYPYLIRAKESGEKTITVADAMLYAAEEISVDCSSIREKYTFTATYSKLSSTELPQGEGYYTLIDGEWQPVTEEVTLDAFRFYLKVDSRNGDSAAEAKSIRIRIVGENGEDDTTGITNSQITIDNSQLVYDLQGRRVAQPTKGIYIVNGKKVVIK